jgi:hypothetical protein
VIAGQKTARARLEYLITRVEELLGLRVEEEEISVPASVVAAEPEPVAELLPERPTYVPTEPPEPPAPKVDQDLVQEACSRLRWEQGKSQMEMPGAFASSASTRGSVFALLWQYLHASFVAGEGAPILDLTPMDVAGIHEVCEVARAITSERVTDLVGYWMQAFLSDPKTELFSPERLLHHTHTYRTKVPVGFVPAWPTNDGDEDLAVKLVGALATMKQERRPVPEPAPTDQQQDLPAQG